MLILIYTILINIYWINSLNDQLLLEFVKCDHFEIKPRILDNGAYEDIAYFHLTLKDSIYIIDEVILLDGTKHLIDITYETVECVNEKIQSKKLTTLLPEQWDFIRVIRRDRETSEHQELEKKIKSFKLKHNIRDDIPDLGLWYSLPIR